MYILCIDNNSHAFHSSVPRDMSVPRYIADLALMPKSALNKCWRYIEGAMYLFKVYHFIFDAYDNYVIHILHMKFSTVDSCYYVDCLLRYIGYYVGNSKRQTISYINHY